MTTLTNYVDYITIKFQEILRNDGYALSKGEQKNSYHLKDWKLCSINEKKEHLSLLDEFLDNLKKYINDDGQLNFIYENNVDNVNLYYDFSRDIFKKLFYDNPFESREKQPPAPTVDELI